MSTSPYIIEITKDNYQTDVIERSAQVPVLVDFWAPWCQPCKILMPVLANLAEQYQACLRPRDRFWDIPVPKIDSAFDNLFVPQPSWSPSTTQQL
ncbi:thioredoxin family protein, partial [Thiolapillus sp.]|uniref:thioredoxin family protein n=1 Tax=Thiolapillus sp. TaxID=2017437 RepID=UPI003AF59B9A